MMSCGIYDMDIVIFDLARNGRIQIVGLGNMQRHGEIHSSTVQLSNQELKNREIVQELDLTLADLLLGVLISGDLVYDT